MPVRTDRDPSSAAPWRRLGIVLLIALGIVAAIGLGLLAVPVWLNSDGGRSWLLARAESALRPGRFEADRIEFSWFGPTRMTGFRLRDHQGDLVVSAPEATWDRNLWQAIFGRPQLGSLRLDAAAIDIEQREDGSIDLVETLQPILGGAPDTSFVLTVENASMRLRAPELATPFEARNLLLRVRRPADPAPLEWTVRATAVAGQPGVAAGRLSLEGKLDKSNVSERAVAENDLDLRIQCERWPLALTPERAGVRIDGSTTATLNARRRQGVWSSAGEAAIDFLMLRAKQLEDESLQFARVESRWDLERMGSNWLFREVELVAPGTRLSARGELPVHAGRELKVEATSDLAQLLTQLPPSLAGAELVRVVGGVASVQVDAGFDAEAGGTRWNARADLSDLVLERDQRTLTLTEPARVRLVLLEQPDRFALREFEVATSYLTATGTGDVDKGVVVDGTFDLAALGNDLAAFWSGGPRDPAGRGTFHMTYRREESRYLAELEGKIDDLVIIPEAAEQPAANGVPRPPQPAVAGVPHPPRPQPPQPPMTYTARFAGPAGPSGWPTALHEVDAEARAPDFEAALTARGDSSGLSLFHLDAMTLRPLGPDRLTAHAQADARRIDDRVVIERATLSTGPEQEPAHAAPRRIELAMRGEYIPETNTLTLVPLEGARPGAALALSERGLSIAHVGRPDWQASGDLSLDLTAVQNWLNQPERNDATRLEGTGDLHLELGGGESMRLSARLRSNDLAWRDGEDVTRLGPALVDLQARISENAGRWLVDLPSLGVSLPAVHVQATGRLDDPLGERVADLQGTVKPNWEWLSTQLAERTEPGARVTGTAGSFRVKGPLDADHVVVETALGLLGAEVHGMSLGPGSLRARWEQGALSFASIETTLNGGLMVLHPELIQDENGEWLARLGPGSTIDNAVVNDEVSHRVLAYVAPVLDKATRVSGKVSARFDRAELPLNPDYSDEAIVEGVVVFHDVQFAPGPLAYQIYQALNVPPATIRLDHPVLLSVRDGMVHQRGFSFPLGTVGRVTLDGTVGFNRQIDMLGRVGMASERFESVPVFNQIAPALRLDFPIGGTLSDPQIDLEGLARSAGRMGIEAVKGAGIGGIEALINAINQPPPSPEEAARMRAEREARQLRQREEQQRRQEERRQRREERKRLRNP